VHLGDAEHWPFAHCHSWPALRCTRPSRTSTRCTRASLRLRILRPCFATCRVYPRPSIGARKVFKGENTKNCRARACSEEALDDTRAIDAPEAQAQARCVICANCAYCSSAGFERAGVISMCYKRRPCSSCCSSGGFCRAWRARPTKERKQLKTQYKSHGQPKIYLRKHPIDRNWLILCKLSRGSALLPAMAGT
jgi:hypothetical protein